MVLSDIANSVLYACFCFGGFVCPFFNIMNIANNQVAGSICVCALSDIYSEAILIPRTSSDLEQP